jgi:hypothetical protein
VSPLRVESGIAASISIDDPLPMLVRGSLPMLSRAGFAVDAVANAWNQWVLSYNTQRQQQFLRNLGLDSTDWKSLSVLLLASQQPTSKRSSPLGCSVSINPEHSK